MVDLGLVDESPTACAGGTSYRKRITLTGVPIPIQKEIYVPVLNGIEELGIKMVEEQT
jgi:hypothetical protein